MLGNELENEKDLVVVIWANPNSVHSDRGRPFETIVKHGSRFPSAWRLSYLQGKYSGLMPHAYVVLSEDDLRSWMSPPLYATSTRERPLIVPVSLARKVFNWQDFDVWGDEVDG